MMKRTFNAFWGGHSSNDGLTFAFILALLLVSNFAIGQRQYLKATINKNSIDTAFVIYPESYVQLGYLKPDTIELAKIPIDSSGYVSFSFSKMGSQDDITVSLENADRSIFYQMKFANSETIISDHQGMNMVVSSDTRLNSLFKIRKCNGTVTWLENDFFPIINQSISIEDSLTAKIYVQSATDVDIGAIFDTTSEDCEKCPFVNGASLFSGDLMFTGYDNDANGQQIRLTTLAPIYPVTAFSLVQGIYDLSDNHWYDATGVDGQLAIQRIVYQGLATIPANSTICLTLPTTGFGDDLLATNFSINGSSSTDFCVQNGGNMVNPQINLSSSNPSALFLVQGNWKLLDAHGEFSGRVLSGLQYGGDWKVNGQSPSGGLSNIPSDIECMFIEDGLSPAIRYAYYTGATASIAAITNFSNWQTGSGALPNAACGSPALIATNQSRNTNQKISHNIVYLYPNPFSNSFTIQLDLATPQRVKIDIYEPSGRLVYQQAFIEMGAGSNQIPITFPNGTSDVIFWTRIQLAEEIIVKRLVKQGTGLN